MLTRWLSALLAALLLAVGLSGCARTGQGNVLHVLVGSDPNHAAARRAWEAQLSREFRARTGATLAFDTFANTQDEQTRIQTSILTGAGPDVYVLGTTFTPVAASTGSFHVLTAADWRRIGGRGRFLPAALGMSGPDPRHDIGVPLALRPYGMVYNTAMFRAAGIARPPATWDEFAADAERLTRPQDGVYGTEIAYADNADPWKFIWSLTLQSGGRLTSADLRRSALDSPQVAAAFFHYFDLLTADHVVPPAAVGWNDAQGIAAFAAGKVAMLPMVNPQAEHTLDASPVKGGYAFAPLPLVPFGAAGRPPGGQAAGSIVSGDNLVVADYTKHLGLALDFLALATSPAQQLYYHRAFGDLPSVASVQRRLAAQDPKVPEFLAAEQTSVPTAFSGAWGQIQLGLCNVVSQTLPALAQGHYSRSAVRRLLAGTNGTVQTALDRQPR